MTALVSNSVLNAVTPPSAESVASPTVAPRTEYQRRLAEFARHAQQQARADRRLSLTRAVLFVAEVGLVAWGVSSADFNWWFCLVPVSCLWRRL